MEVYLVRDDDSGLLMNAHNIDYDKVQSLTRGEVYKCKITKPRNYKYLQKFFALISIVFHNQEQYRSQEQLRKDIIIEAGYYDAWIDFNGNLQKEAKSISFGSMTAEEFSALYTDVVNVIVDKLKVTKEDLADEIEQYF